MHKLESIVAETLENYHASTNVLNNFIIRNVSFQLIWNKTTVKAKLTVSCL